MLRKTALAEGETYHIYNRGAHKGKLFGSEEDYHRFMLLLHVCNSSTPVLMRDLFSKYRGRSYADIFSEEKPDKLLVDVLAYCLMPNHYHLVLRQKTQDGITKFMARVGTSYSMYFNTKYEHSGVLFQGRFKSSHLDSEPYYRYIFSYVHLNPVELAEPEWKESGIKNLQRVENFLSKYGFSSYPDYKDGDRPERSILSQKDVPEFLKQDDLKELYRWFAEDRPVRDLQ